MIENASRAPSSALVAILSSGLLLTACGGGGSNWPNSLGGTATTPPPATTTPTATAAPLTCDDTLKTNFKPDANTSVVAVKAFKKGDALLLSGSASASTPTAANDVCLVKLNVGPGNPGPADAPSTSAGIGIEIWLPTRDNWNGRIHNLGGGGWQGGVHGSPTAIANQATATGMTAAGIAATEGAVSAATDTGHSNTLNGGSFAMKPDGTINTQLWQDFASRSLHEMALKSKALANAYYGKAQTYAYFEGYSTGGRQGMKSAQANPEDYDGIVAGTPAFNWTRFITAELYPQVVFQRDLGGVVPTTAQQDLMSNAAITACGTVGGQALGYILDPASCTYDPTTDVNVLCPSSGGTNNTAACVSTAQAAAMNKVWYGMTADGSAPAPSADTGWTQAASTTLPSGNQRWFGLARGASTYMARLAAFGINGLTSPNGAVSIGGDQVALELQDPTIADAMFVNATGNGQSKWKGLSYAQLSNAFDRGVALQTAFADINTDNPDLSAFKARGGKLLHWHGLADELIFPQGSVNYYNRVVAAMNGRANVDPFYRLFLLPGLGHGVYNGTANPAANPPVPGVQQLSQALTDWVEKGVAPQSMVLNSATAVPVAKSQPACAYPSKVTYKGSGDPFAAASYACQ